jgi:hypothetical protein
MTVANGRHARGVTVTHSCRIVGLRSERCDAVRRTADGHIHDVPERDVPKRARTGSGASPRRG